MPSRHSVERYDGAPEFFAEWLDSMSLAGWEYIGLNPEGEGYLFRQALPPQGTLSVEELAEGEERAKRKAGEPRKRATPQTDDV